MGYTPLDRVYIAGLFDGAGKFVTDWANNPGVEIELPGEEGRHLATKLTNYFGYGSLRMTRDESGASCWHWSVLHGADVHSFLTMVFTELRLRKNQAVVVLESWRARQADAYETTQKPLDPAKALCL